MCLRTFVLSCFVPFSAGCGFGGRMTGGCLAGQARLLSLRPCHVKHTCALWDLVIPWYCEHIFWPAPCSLTNTPCYKMEESGVKGQALLQWNRKCRNRLCYTLQPPPTCGQDWCAAVAARTWIASLAREAFMPNRGSLICRFKMYFLSKNVVFFLVFLPFLSIDQEFQYVKFCHNIIFFFIWTVLYAVYTLQ